MSPPEKEPAPELEAIVPAAAAKPEPKRQERPLLEGWQDCPVCWRKHKGPGRYCSSEHEELAQVPAGNNLKNHSKSYTAS